MKTLFVACLCMLLLTSARGQVAKESRGSAGRMSLDSLLLEAVRANPEIHSALSQAEVMEARIRQAGVLDDPEFTYMRELMPGFNWNEAQMQRLELMQMIRFPSKLTRADEIATLQAYEEHAMHDERTNDVLASVKTGYYDLWLAQQMGILNGESIRLVEQIVSAARTRYAVGSAGMQDVLKGTVELTRARNDGIVARQQELSAKAMLMALLNRQPGDSLGTASLSAEPARSPSLDTLQYLAVLLRPMVRRDSIAVDEGRTMLSLAHSEYLPDFKLTLQYVTEPTGSFRGWSVFAGISLPFAPWTLARSGGRVEEAEATLRKSVSGYQASRTTVVAEVQDTYYRVESAKEQFVNFRDSILPQAQQALLASMAEYQTGKTDILMLLDACRTYLDLRKEALMARMQFEHLRAALEHAVGVRTLDLITG